MDFQVEIDSTLIQLSLNEGIQNSDKKHLLSLLNDFEDGAWRLDKFNNFIWDNITETALSQRERLALQSRHSTALKDAAKKLRLTDAENDISKGSELAEIALYGIMRHFYGGLPVVPKIFYKQNSQDNAKGADSVHIVVTEDNDFTLWFGEAKFYSSIEDARLNSIIDSVENSLQTDKLKKENSIITNISDLSNLGLDVELVEKIKAALSNSSSIDPLKSLIHVPILLLHECELTKLAKEVEEKYLSEVQNFHLDRACSYFKKQSDKLSEKLYKYADITFHLILFPVSNKEEVVNKFVDEVAFHKG